MQDGFTLIELLIVIAIIAVLAYLLTPSYRGAIGTSDTRAAQMHALSVRTALNTAIASNPQLDTSTLGTINCTTAQDITPNGLTSPNGGNGWDNAPTGDTCQATPLTSRTYQVSVTTGGGQTVTSP